jgi:HEAT repeat protein
VTAAHRLAKFAPIAPRAIPVLLAALDGADPELEAALTTALDAIGPPPAEYVRLLVSGLESRSDTVRRYAVHSFADRNKAPEEAIPALVTLLSDPHAPVRLHAAEALDRVGGKARPLALGPLVARAADLDPTVRKAAAKAVESLGKPDLDDKPVLQTLLTDKSPQIRAAALALIAPLVTTGDQAVDTYLPLLLDPTAEIRLAALRGLAAFPDVLPTISASVVPLLGDSNKEVRSAAIGAVVQMPRVPKIVDKVAKARDAELVPELRDAFANAVVTLSAPQPADVPALRAVLVDGPPKVQRAAADKLSLLGRAAAPAIDDLIALATNPDAGVRSPCLSSALLALAAIGPEAKSAIPVAAPIFKDKAAPIDARQAAVAVLAATGPDGVKELKDATIYHLPAPVQASMCAAFAALGADARDMHPWMIDVAETVSDCRSAVSDALVRAGTDDSILELTKRTDVFRTGKPGEPDHKYPTTYRKWALQTLGKMDLAKVITPKTREVVESRMKNRAEDTDADIARFATAVLKKLKE